MPSLHFNNIDPAPSPSNCTDYDVRLHPTEVDSPSRGMLQICLSGAWGAVCDGGIGYNAHHHTCTQLGFQRRGMFIV